MSMHLGRASALLAAALAAVASAPAQAALGGDVASVLRDQQSLQATHSVTPAANYDLYESITADGMRLREYVDRSGKVFGITWQGRRSPDVAALLGTHAARYLEEAHAQRGNHHVLTINDADLLLSVVRLPRGWRGQAYLPSAIPAGVNRAELK